MENTYASTQDKSSWTAEQRQQHYLNVCAAAGLDPELGLLKWTWMDRNEGFDRHLVLYATKGATNAIREIQGIDIVSLTDKIITGAYVVTATAKNAKGRTDIATGASVIEGKRGKALENAFALAQTRATRRVTLQMSGLDLLDESEVTPDGAAPVADSPVLPDVAQPANPSSAVGADITAPSGLTLRLPGTPAAALAPAPAPTVEERLPNPAAGLKLATTNLAGPGINRSAVPEPTKVEFHVQLPPHVGEVVVGIPAVPAPVSDQPATVSPVTQSEEAPKRKKRRTKEEMAAARAAEAPVAQEVANAVVDAAVDAVQAQSPEAGNLIETAAAIVEAVSEKPAVPVGNVPTPEQMTDFVTRLKQYRDVVLPQGGMIPSNGLGPNAKLRKFFSVANNGVEDLTKLTSEQWINTFQYMDKVLAEKGAKDLVSVIEHNIAQVGAA